MTASITNYKDPRSDESMGFELNAVDVAQKDPYQNEDVLDSFTIKTR